MKLYTQQYLITMDGEEPFFTEWFDRENNYRPDLNMVVYDLNNHRYTTDGTTWHHIESDHL